MVIAALTVNAKSWRINNNEALKPNFTSINAAMSSEEVQDGDTLYLDPGCTLSDAQTVSKAVTVVGPGYFLENLPYNEAYIGGGLTISAENSKLEGLHANVVTINASHVTLERCRAARISGSYSYATIRSCFLYSSVSYNTISGNKNWTIENCIIVTTSSSYVSAISSCTNSIIRNNYIYHTYNRYSYAIADCSGCEITNNIIQAVNSGAELYNVSNCTITNNILSHAYTSWPNNKVSTISISTENDLAYKLSSDSPAKGYATDGGDCGPYGSGYTYVPSGLPFGHPYYTAIQVGSPAKDGKLNVSYKVKVQDE